MKIRFTSLTRLSALLCAMLFSSTSIAAFMTYDDESAFTSALASYDLSILDFDSSVAGDTIASGDQLAGITFDYSLPDFGLAIRDDFDTTSTANYLGIDDFDGAFENGNAFTMSFDSAQAAIGVYITSADEIFDGDVTLTTNTGLVADLTATLDVTLDDGDAYFLGLFTDELGDAFTSVTLSSFYDELDPASVQFFFNVDDISYAPAPIPLPPSLLLFASALFGLAYRIRK